MATRGWWSGEGCGSVGSATGRCWTPPRGRSCVVVRMGLWGCPGLTGWSGVAAGSTVWTLRWSLGGAGTTRSRGCGVGALGRWCVRGALVS